MDELLSLVKDIAPGVATLLGGPLAGGVVSFLGNRLLGNASASATDIVTALKDPDAAVKMKQIETELQIAQINASQKTIDDSTSVDLANLDLVKTAEATPGMFGRWHDALGWLCIAVLFFDTIGIGIASMFHINTATISLNEFLPILMTIIGARTFEKYTGVHK